MSLCIMMLLAFALVMPVLVPVRVCRVLARVLVEELDRMSFLRKRLREQEIPRGRYTYRGRDKFAGLALQLRVEPNGLGVMVINANTVLYLNETATAYA
jgi:hypothetical protein